MADINEPHDSANKPMRLARQHSGVAPSSLTRIAEVLRNGCRCGSETASLCRQRTKAAYWIVKVQCDHCGSPLGGALSRDDHPGFMMYPEWDEALREAYHEKRRNEAEERLDRFWQEHEERKIRYSAFLWNNPQWKEIRDRVMRRANYQCEACLNQRATEVHHITYDYGALPPAFYLRALCARCHYDIHAGWPKVEA